MAKFEGPKVLIFDIETAPIIAYVWGLWENNVALNQIHTDWHILSWSAKWLHENKIMYMDQRDAKKIEDDTHILIGIWKLLDEADIVITQNGKAFDSKKLNARFVLQGLRPPSPYRHIDTFLIAKKHFAFTSNKLEYMSKKLGVKYTKLDHKKFPGFELWKECLAGNPKAWKEMEKYNKHDVLSLEEVYKALIPWDNTINFNTYYNDNNTRCTCGSTDIQKHGLRVTTKGKYQRYHCMDCGKSFQDSKNLLSKEKKEFLKS